jgi:hypothetical protein
MVSQQQDGVFIVYPLLLLSQGDVKQSRYALKLEYILRKPVATI